MFSNLRFTRKRLFSLRTHHFFLSTLHSYKIYGTHNIPTPNCPTATFTHTGKLPEDRCGNYYHLRLANTWKVRKAHHVNFIIWLCEILYVRNPYAIYYHLVRKQFMQFYIHNTTWMPLFIIISSQSVMNVIIYYMYSKELHHCALLYTFITLLVITLVKRYSHITQHQSIHCSMFQFVKELSFSW